MAELDIETARRAITTILESLLFTIKASAKELEKHYSSEYIAKSFNFLFETIESRSSTFMVYNFNSNFSNFINTCSLLHLC